VHRKTKYHYHFYKKIVYMKNRFLRKDLDSTDDERLIESYLVLQLVSHLFSTNIDVNEERQVSRV